MKIKKLLAATLAGIMGLANMIPTNPLNTAATAQASATELSDPISDMTIESTNSFGSLLASELTEKQAEQLANNGCNIFSVEMDGNEATVSYQTVVDCTLVIGIYDEDGTTLYATGTVEVSPDERETTVTIETDEMPQYFYVKGYLADSFLLSPLCTVYECPNYTQEMQEFFAKTVDDFDEQKVINFDDDKTNNFAVYGENTIVIPENEGYNIVTSADDENSVYIIENADENVLALQSGDIFSYRYGENELLIAKIDTIDIDGTTVTITGAELSLQDAFEYVRIEKEQGTEDAVISGFTFEDETKNISAKKIVSPAGGVLAKDANIEADGDVTYENDTITGKATLHASISKEFDYDSTKYNKSDDVFKIKGSFNADEVTTLDLYCKFYVHSDDQYVEIKLNYSAKLTLDAELDLTEDVKLPTVAFTPAPGIILKFTPILNVKGNIDVHIEDSLTGAIGFRASLKNGITDISERPVFHSQLDAQGELYIGLTFKSQLSLGSKKICQISLTGTGGIQLNSQYYYDRTTDLSTGENIGDNTAMRLHPEGGCLEGKVSAKFSIEASVSFLDSDKWLRFGLDPATKTIDLLHFYRCGCGDSGAGNYGNFIDGYCPHWIYQVTVGVTDTNGDPIPDAEITADNPDGVLDATGTPITAVTDEKGEAIFYIMVTSKDKDLHYTYSVSAEGFHSKDVAEPVYKVFTLNNMDSGDTPLTFLSFEMYRDNTEPTSTEPAPTEPGEIEGKKVVQVSLGSCCSAAITADGSLYTWGQNFYGQLGDHTTEDKSTPVKIMDNVVSVSLGFHHCAAITINGSLYMWGENDFGQLGNGILGGDDDVFDEGIDSNVPIKIMDNVASVSLGNCHSAAITTDGSLYTWGYNKFGQLGNGTTENGLTPVKVMDNVASVSLGGCHSAAITTDGSLYTWGRNYNGQLGDGTKEDKSTPVKIMDNVASVSLGGFHSATITTDGSLYTWGSNTHGELGNGANGYEYDILTPVKIMDNVALVSLGIDHTAIINTDGSLYTWGSNGFGQLGDGTKGYKSTPVKIMDDVASVSLGNCHSAAITTDGSLYTWGYNYFGQLGNGESGEDENGEYLKSTVPIKIVTPQTSLTDLEPNTIYNYYLLSTTDTDKLLTPANIQYITQFVSSSSGTANIDIGSTPITEDAVMLVVPAETTKPTYGDVDGNGNISISDVVALNKYLLGDETAISESGKANADVDANGMIESLDSLNILKCCVKLIDEDAFPLA